MNCCRRLQKSLQHYRTERRSRSVPVNGDPSLMVTVKLATTAPSGVVSGIVGLLGVTVITGTGGGGGGGGGGGW